MENRVKHLYVHVPFCRCKCVYCDFESRSLAELSTNPAQLMDSYIAAVLLELERQGECLEAPLDTLYIGGGTPSLLGPERVALLVEALGAGGLLDRSTEFTIEVNPDSAWDARDYGNLGINRVSVGVQSLDDAILKDLRRPHDAARALKVLEESAARVPAVSADLIMGIPAFPSDRRLAEIDRIAASGAGHISLYMLTPSNRAPYFKTDCYVPLGEDQEAEILETVFQKMDSLGFDIYEVSNYARGAAARCRHNLGYWNHDFYLGLGAGAHSFLPGDGARQAYGLPGHFRRWNKGDASVYISALEAGDEPPSAGELLSDEALRLERLMLGLRCEEGVDLDRLERDFRWTPGSRNRSVLGRFLEEAAVTIDGRRLKTTRAGMVKADGIALALLES